jgi:hypothetical protein
MSFIAAITNIENEDELQSILRLVDKAQCACIKTIWISKINDVIRYGNKPFSNENDFFMEITIESIKRENLEFLNYLVRKYKNNLNYLQKCLSL